MSEQEQIQTELERKLRAEVASDGDDPESVGEETTHAPEALESDPDAPTTDPEDASASEEPLDPIEALQRECEELKDKFLRSRAEFDNYRKRTSREVERIRKSAAESVIHDLLPVLDNLELALQHGGEASGPLTEGVTLVLRQMIEILEKCGLEAIEAQGQPFDPNIHEAVSQMASDEVAKDSVVVEYQRGYKLGGQVLRPSKVVVSSGPEDASSDADGEN